MGIDFHNKNNQKSYTKRTADISWMETIKKIVPIAEIGEALDIGCGGGIYSKALADMGVAHVTGVDFSEPMLNGAKENCKNYHQITFQLGNAYETGLDDNLYDLLLERALIHHIEDLYFCFVEAYRVLKDNAYYIIQDRTPEDCLLEGSDHHIRGYFFELFPRLAEKEMNRRYKSQFVTDMLQKVGFQNIEEIKLWETRKMYDTKEQLLIDLTERTGRSILHELSDAELNRLVKYIDSSLSIEEGIVEKDRWTIWKAVK
ncbi:class I SAM-dependent methyltransferase [Salinibacillus xinjiangensis]|uniref:Methyltransferase domain-containing protein n=1 Tax=Salinibacillus xinjiangensis TaxID=1229268 RepID=A0A6G1X4J2_9BACI|nr:class I SAM-dependent methyltransferase [Salinibacillus xinjiangensis]MRG85913.1 methyltransferase domain-containing protein [Salinibacillus xinjiangensis]